MKMRHGFVSNSSSTSYVIAVKKPTTPIEELILKAIGIIANADRTEFEDKDAGTYIDFQKYKKEELEKDIEFAQKRVIKLTNMLKDKKLAKVLEIAEDFREELDLHRSRVESEYKWTPQSEIDRLKVNIVRSSEHLKAVTDRIDKLDGIEAEDRILSFSRDNWQSTDIKEALKLFDEYGKVIKIIEIYVS